MGKDIKAEYLNPFITTSVEIINGFLPDGEVNRGELSTESTPFITSGTATYIGISGDLEGRVIFDMETSTAIEVAGVMNEDEFDEVNDIVRSTIQELGNIICGNATTELRSIADDKTIDITPPSLIVGSDTQISDSVSDKYIKVPLETNHGPIFVNLAIQDNE